MSPNDAPKLIRDYIKRIDAKYRQGNATEHTYRDDLRALLEGLLGASFTVTNEPKRTEYGAPDYVITKQGLPVAYIEAKDIGRLDFKDKGVREQLARYQEGLSTLVATDYLEFHLFVDGEAKESVRIGQEGAKGITVSVDAELERFLALIVTSIEGATPETITSPRRLAQRMAGATRLLADSISRSLNATPAGGSILNPLMDLKENLRRSLKYNLRNEEFADLYAQTIAYGLFIARYHDNSGDFSVGRAVELLHGSSTLLYQLFGELRMNRTDSIAWIIDQLALLLANTDTHAILEAYQLERGDNDPTVHLYEDFLSEYNPALRREKGVYYTPLPVVRFIAGAVHLLLQTEFKLAAGLADTSTLPDGNHRVQILDPATGTGTFLAEVVRLVHEHRKHHVGLGDWPSYVEQHLLPRLFGFELMMAPYTIAHLKLGLQLQASGYRPSELPQIGILLNNSLEEDAGESGGRWWLAQEATHALEIQQRAPVMVLLGNPPYNGASQNKGKAIMDLLQDYKREPGEKTTAKREERRPLDEQNPKWINNDYVKFIRLAERYIERNGTGIVAFITSHSFLDAPTFRGMRWHLLQTFDRIYTVDLHGNYRTGETKSGDENVFAIQTGVAITLFVRTKERKRTLGQVFHHELWGTQREKFDWLNNHDLNGVPWQTLSPQAPYYLFVPRENRTEMEYLDGFALDRLFPLFSVGVATTKDSFTVCDSPQEVATRMHDLITLDDARLQAKYPDANLRPTTDWTIARARTGVGAHVNPDLIRPYAYRPFDNRWLYYTGKSASIVGRPRYETFSNYLAKGLKNVSLIVQKQLAGDLFSHAWVSDRICDLHLLKDGCYHFPLYTVRRGSISAGRRTPGPLGEGEEFVPNFREEVYRDICERLGEEVEPQTLFDYIYAVLHCTSYRERYAEQLRIGFPRIPYPTDRKAFHRLVELGGRLRGLHLLEDAEGWDTGVRFDGEGDSVADNPKWVEADGVGRVYINATQYFSPIPRAVWDFQVGSYQPMQKWLKDRKGRAIDTEHYRRMVYAVRATLVLMGEIESLWGPVV